MVSEDKKAEAETGALKEDTTAVDSTPHETVGAMLRRVRLEKRLDVRDIATYLCIRTQFLEDIENDNFRNLPGETYASGFIRSYAAYLGLDSNETDMRFRSEMTAVKDADRKTSTAEPEPETTSPDGKIIFGALILLALFYGAWKFYTRTEQEEVTVVEEQEFELQNPNPVDNVITTDDVYIPSEEKKVKTAPAVPAEKTTPAASAVTPVVQVTPVETAIPEPKPVAEKTVTASAGVVDTAVAEAAAVSHEKAENASDTAAVATQGALRDTPAEAVVAEKRTPRFFGAKNVNGRVLLTAVEETWIEVSRETDDGTEILLSRLLFSGDRYRFPDEENIFLRTGNAGGLKITVDGREIPAIGPRGATRTRVVMDADALADTLDD